MRLVNETFGWTFSVILSFNTIFQSVVSTAFFELFHSLSDSLEIQFTYMFLFFIFNAVFLFYCNSGSLKKSNMVV